MKNNKFTDLNNAPCKSYLYLNCWNFVILVDCGLYMYGIIQGEVMRLQEFCKNQVYHIYSKYA